MRIDLTRRELKRVRQALGLAIQEQLGAIDAHTDWHSRRIPACHSKWTERWKRDIRAYQKIIAKLNVELETRPRTPSKDSE